MFTIVQVEEAFAKLKFGEVDCASHFAELKSMGLLKYDHFMNDGSSVYYGSDGHSVKGGPKWDTVHVAKESSVEKLKSTIAAFQAGQVDYKSFCRQTAEAGVYKWVTDIEKMVCIYCDASGEEMLTESIST